MPITLSLTEKDIACRCLEATPWENSAGIYAVNKYRWQREPIVRLIQQGRQRREDQE
jgi:hypothetical protein